jgi:alanyl-tRNA synthetase
LLIAVFMTGNEIREKFLAYFERQGHTRVRSSPLLPANDPTLLFTNAGMNQFKDAFLGLEQRDYARATSSQKCVRAGGKHNDLDEVGKTARHQTFFEMLGNFSFGDYFKQDAIKFAWDLLVNEFKLDPARMWFSVYGGDDEVPADVDAENFWEQVGAPRSRILRFGRKDNFWQMGETGPCGPCSEIHYYMGPDPSDAENCAANVNGPGDTITEIWNLVFMQFDRSEVEPGKYTLAPLPAPSVDTGMGLERVTAVLQGVKSNYDTDLLRNIVEFSAKLADRHYEADTQEGFAMRVIADHARATAFLITDGIVPGNEGRNYVLRKIMRRAIYHGRHALNFQNAFFYKVTDFVVDQMHDAFPELEASREFIGRMVRMEEERFGSTLTIGLEKLDELFARTPAGQIPAYTDLARLYDTFGTPRDLIRVGLEDRGFQIGEDEFIESFDAALQQIQHTGAREHAAGQNKAKPVYGGLLERAGSNQFTGYEGTRLDDSKALALVKGDEEVAALHEGEAGEVILDRSPFYAESGGQVGDTGTLATSSAHITVTDTVSPLSGLIVHRVKVDRGILKVGDEVIAQVDADKRDATRRNHTATHLVHAALREVLGGHVKQGGSVVAPNFLRFDFTHFQPLNETETAEVERLVNEQILRNVKVSTDIMSVEEAVKSGAMALFGEKYSGMMRVLTVPGFSRELCGGTHVGATGDIGVFKIVSDESIASGVRRLRAVTGTDALQRFRDDELLLDQVAGNLRTSRAELPAVITRLQDELKKARRETDELRLKIASGASGSSSSNGDESREVAGIRVLARAADGLDAAGMRQLSDTLLARIKSGVVVLGRTSDGKVSLIVRTSADVSGKVPAGQVIKELAPIIGGKGGGKPDMAEGGGNQPEKLAEALNASYGVIKKLLNQ